MDWSRTPLVECFERGEAPREVRLMAARGGLELRVPEQLAVLMVLVSDQDPDIAARAARTISRLPPDELAAVLASPDVPDAVRGFFSNRPPEDTLAASEVGWSEGDEPDLDDETGDRAQADAEPQLESAPGAPAADEVNQAAADVSVAHLGATRRLSKMTVAQRIKTAIHGTREERSILIRDPNRIVAAAVMSSPKLTEGDVEMIARMTNVSDDVLRQIGTNRNWVKSYSVMAALARNAKTPIGVSLALLPRLAERDVRMLATDRNIPEPVRMSARKLNLRNTTRRQ